MIRVPAEKRSNSFLISFIDLLFLLVAFFTLLLFFLQSKHQASEEELIAVQKSIAKITGEEVDISEIARKLEPMLDRFMAREQVEAKKERERVEKALRKQQRSTFKMKYELNPDGTVIYKNKTYTLSAFRDQVVNRLRQTHWISFQGYASPETSFGEVVRSRGFLLENSNEFDTYWDNVTRSPASK